MARRPMSKALPSSLNQGPRPPARAVRPLASRPNAAEPVPARRMSPFAGAECGFEGDFEVGCRRALRAFGKLRSKNWSTRLSTTPSGLPLPARRRLPRIWPAVIFWRPKTASAASLSANHARVYPAAQRIRWTCQSRGRERWPSPSASTHSVFVPPPSKPRKYEASAADIFGGISFVSSPCLTVF